MLQESDKHNSNENLTPKEQANTILQIGMILAEKCNFLPVATTSGGKYSATLMNLLVENNIDIPVIFIDMGSACYTKETYEMIRNFQNMGIDIHWEYSHIESLNHPPSLRGLNKIYGPDWRNPTSLYYEQAMGELKQIPCERTLDQLIKKNKKDGVVLFRGTRINPNIPERTSVHFIDQHKKGIVVHPIARWSDEVTVNYINENKLSVNNGHTDPSRARLNAEGERVITYADGTSFLADHTVCVLDKKSEEKT